MNNPGFIDKNRPVQQKYHELLDRMDQESMSQQKIIKLMERLIDQDPHFLDPYLYLHEIYQYENKQRKATEILNSAFDQAIELITNKKGEWPQALYWGWTENRHIIRTILNKALSEWDQGNNEEAAQLLRKLFKTNPQDNIGARYYILAIRLGFTLAGFEDRFNKGGYYNNDLNNWFDEHASRYPEEFDSWLKEMEKQGM